jgi:hypothetical protein
MNSSTVSLTYSRSDEAIRDRASSSGATRNYAVLYSFAVFLLPVLALFASIPIARSNWLFEKTKNVYLANLAYAVKLKNAGCDVVIYGDSSAMTGVDPAVVRTKTGLETCNIAEFEGMTMVNGTMIPDIFLTQNKQPKYMIFLYSPEDLGTYNTWQTASRFEAILARVRLHPNFGTVRLLMQHPADAFDFAAMTLRIALTDGFGRGLPAWETHLREQHNGLLPMGSQSMRACDARDVRLHEPDPGWLEMLRKRYKRTGTRVLVDVTPVPICEPTYNYYVNQLSGLTDNHLERWPLDLYFESGRLHFTPPGVVKLSNVVADQVNAAKLENGDAVR